MLWVREQLCGPRRGSRARGVAARLPGVQAVPSWNAQLVPSGSVSSSATRSSSSLWFRAILTVPP